MKNWMIPNPVRRILPAPLRSGAVAVLAGLALSACGTRAVKAPSPPPEPRTPPLPNVELTPDILYDVLVGEVAGQRGELDVAVIALSRAAQRTRDPRLAARATQAGMYAKQYDQALVTARLWVELRPESLEAREALATILLDQNEPAEAQLHLEQALAVAQKKGNLGQVFMRLAGLLARHGNRTAALEVMDTLVRLYPNSGYGYLALAHLGVRAGNLDAALQASRKALALRPDWEEAAMYYTRILISQKEIAAAEAFFKDFIDRHPRANRVRLNYARFLVDHKQWEKARKQFKQIVKYSPKDADAIFAVGLLSVQAERYEEAQEYLLRHLELRPGNDQARLYLGQVAEQQKQLEEAARWYREISSPKYFFDAQMRLALVMARGGDVEGARIFLRQVNTESDEQRAQVVLVEEQILREAKRFHEALQILNVALESLPEHTDILYARALVAEKLDLLDVTERDLRAILKRDPNNAHALNALGYTLADRTDRIEEAEQLIKRALEQKPNDAFVLDSMGWVQYRKGNYQEAIHYLKKALSLRNDAEISAHLGEVLWMAGDRAGARNVWGRALKQTPDNESLRKVIKKFTDE